MRLLFTTFLALMSLALFSQSPEKINYQSIVRDLAGNVIQNQPISLRMSILSDSINGTIVYQETFQPTTNNFGLVNIKIGEGTPVIATMSSVDWSNGPFFLESAVDVTGGTNYIVVSTSQFMSVPYALYAKESPLDTTQVQNIVNQQTNNFLDSSSIQNMIDSSVLNIDSTLIASWGYIDSNSIMILINNNSLDSTTIQNMIDNSIVNIDSSTVASWGYLDSSTIQILINNSTIDSSSVANWGYLDSTTIQNIITQQTNNYLDSTSVQNMIDNSVTNIDSSTVASWGYVDSNSIMILINNNSLDSVAIQNMINSSITNVDSSTVASWGYLDSSSILALISNSNVDSSSVASWGYLDSVSIQNMIYNSSNNVDSAMIANFGFVAGPHTIDTDTQIDSTGIANYGFVTSSQVLDSSSVQNMINNSSSNVDSSTVSNWGFVDSSTVINLINESGYLDSLTIQSMIDLVNTSITSLGAFGDYQDINFTWSVSNGNNSWFVNSSNRVSQEFYSNNDCFVFIKGSGGFTNDFDIYLFYSDNPGEINQPEKIFLKTESTGSVIIPIPKNKYWRIERGVNPPPQVGSKILEIISDSSLASGSNSNIDSTSISNMGFVDSMTVVNMINSGGGSGHNSFLYPDGYEGEPLYHSFLDSLSYTVPNGKSLYILGRFSDFPSNISINGITIDNNPNVDLHNPFILNGGDVITSGYTGPVDYGFYGFLVTQNIIAITESLSQFNSISYTVPTGKKLYILNFNSGNSDIKVNGSKIFNTSYSYPLTSPIIVDEGDVVSGTFKFNGYLADINYFNSSSNFGSGSNSTIDSTTVANWGFSTDTDTQIDSTGIAGYGYVAGPHTIDTDTQIDSAGIAAMGYLDSVSIRNMIDSMVAQSVSSGSGPSLSFPEGISGTPFSIYLYGTSSSYTVPIGKNLYILNTFNSGNGYLLTTITGSQEYILGTADGERNFDSPIIISEGETISPSSGTAFTINGLLVDKNPSITIENFYLYGTSSSYTVPIGKNLYILNTFNSGNGYLLTTITGSQEYILGTADVERNFDSPIIISEGETISPSSGTTFTINGYLADNNYFNSSSNSGSGSGSNSTIDSTTVANWGFTTDTDTQIDSAGIANLGYVAGPHTIDTDTQIDSAGIAAMGYVAGPHTIDTDTQIDSAGIASHGFLDSVRIMELINQNGTNSTKTFEFPQGYGGDLVSFNFNQSDTTFIVPSDKNYYVMSVHNVQQVQFSSPDVRVNGLGYYGLFGNGGGASVILHPNDSIYVKDYQSMSFLVLAYDTSSAVKMIKHNFNISPTFTVPNGKLFVIRRKNVPVNINNIPSGASLAKGGDVITPTNTPSGNWDWISGYLVDEDYFKTDSGTSSGSGSGSSSGSGSNANTLIFTTNGF